MTDRGEGRGGRGRSRTGLIASPEGAPLALVPRAPLTELVQIDGTVVPLLTESLDVEPTLLDQLMPSLQHGVITDAWKLTRTQKHELLLLLQTGRIQAMCEEMFARHYKGDFHSDAEPMPRKLRKRSQIGSREWTLVVRDALSGARKRIRADDEGGIVVRDTSGDLKLMKPSLYVSYFMRELHRQARLVRSIIVIERDVLRAGVLLASTMYTLALFLGEEKGAVRGGSLHFRAAEDERLEQYVQQQRRSLSSLGGKGRSGKKDPLVAAAVAALRAHRRNGRSRKEAIELLAHDNPDDLEVTYDETDPGVVIFRHPESGREAKHAIDVSTLRNWWKRAK